MKKPLTVFGITSWWWRPLAAIGAIAAVAAAIMLDAPELVLTAILMLIALPAFTGFYRSVQEPLVIEVTDETIRVDDATVEWSEITGLGVDDRGRIELLHGRVALAKIAPHRVENYEQLVRTLLRRVTFHSTWLGDPRTVSIDRGSVMLGLLAPTLFYVMLQAPYHVWVAGALWLYFAVGLLRNCHRLDFDDDGLRLRSLVRGTRFIPRADIRSIRLDVSPSGGIRPMVNLHQGSKVVVTLPTVDAFEIFERARRAYPELLS